MSQDDFPKLVSFFRQASPYINQHWQKTFVIVIPGYIANANVNASGNGIGNGNASGDVKQSSGLGHGIGHSNHLLDKILEDVALLHGLGVRIVLVAGTSSGMDTASVDGYRVTNASDLDAAIHANGITRTAFESKLSKCVPAGKVRRHGYGSHPAGLQVISGNFVTARRRGILDGVDYEFTGEVRGIWSDAIAEHLRQSHVVVLTNLAYSEAGEVLHCNTFDIAESASKALQADKLLVYHLPSSNGDGKRLPAWVKALDADLDLDGDGDGDLANGGARPSTSVKELDLAVQVCRAGVPRTHLIDACIDGALLLELYTRDGIGTMVSRDVYEGMRAATKQDVAQITKLRKPLEEIGTLRKKSRAEITREIDNFVVIEREGTPRTRPLSKYCTALH